MWISQAWLVGLAAMAAAIVGAAFLFGMKVGCVYSERLCARVGINPKWITSLDARQQARKLTAENDDAVSKELQAATEAFEKSGGWTDITLDGEAAQDVLRQLHASSRMSRQPRRPGESASGLGKQVAMRRRRRASVVDTGSLFVDYAAVASTLAVDAAKAEVGAIGAPDDYERRTYARALFAFIDGVTYCQRQWAERDARLTARARVRGRAAAKHAHRIGRKAREKESLALAVRAAFAAMSAAHQVANPLVAAGDPWQSFREAIAVRNRVTHPKSGGDCVVTEADVALLRRVHYWYYDMSSALLKRLTPGGSVPPNKEMQRTKPAQAMELRR